MARKPPAPRPDRRGSTRRLLSYLKPYRPLIGLGLLSTTFASLLDGVTLVVLIPLLQHIFGAAAGSAAATRLETLVSAALGPIVSGVSPAMATVRLKARDRNSKTTA